MYSLSEINLNYKETTTFDFKLSSKSLSSQDTLKMKSTPNFSPSVSNLLTTSVIEEPSNLEILRKLRPVSDEPICRFEFAYAVTCHKAQGSEFDYVIVFDESRVFGEESARWLYTAITRAKEKLLIIR